MIDLEPYHRELEKLKEWDTQGMRYGYEVDVEYTNGRVIRNECGGRRTGADNFQSDLERVANDPRTGRIFIRLYRGVGTKARRMDATKGINDSSPDVILRVNSDNVLTPSLIDKKQSEASMRQQENSSNMYEAFGKLLGIGQGLSGVDAINGIVETRVNTVRRELENERLQEKYDEAKEAAEEAKGEVIRLQLELERMEEEREKLVEQINELKKYDPRTGEGIMGLAVNIGTAALGRAVKSYATKNPQGFSGLFGPEMLAVFSGDTDTQNAQTVARNNPMVEEIASWLNMQSADDVERVYKLVSIWDSNQNLLEAMASSPASYVKDDDNNSEE